MSILKEINESHDFVKAKATNLFLIPFWYVSIYLFNNEFYTKADSLIIISMCITITLTSSFCLTLIFDGIRTLNNGKKYDFFNNTVLSVTLLTSWLSFLIVLFYSLGFIFNIYIYFYWFLVIYSSPIFLIWVLNLIFGNKSEVKK